MLVCEIDISGLDHRLVGSPVGAVVEALPPFLLHRLPLVVEVGLRDVQRAHTVRFEKNPELQLVRRQGLKVIGPLGVRGAVGAAAVVLYQDKMLPFADILRPLKQHMLEQMGEAGPSRPLVTGPDIVCDTDRIGRRAMILGEDNPQTVVQSEFFEGDVEGLG